MSNESHAELRAEQHHLDVVLRRVAELRAEAVTAARDAVARSGSTHQARLERDVRSAEQYGLAAALDAGEQGLCFGRLVFRDGRDHHLGRIGVRRDDEERTPLLVDWRADVARPFYLATGHEPMGLRRRRHITTEDTTVTALQDEIMDLADAERTGFEASDADAVLLASLDAARTGRMHDIVQTIQAEQDDIIRAPRHGVLVVEGGPGTGKTAVALHRAAYLLYVHREQLARRAVLIVGPSPVFLGYIGDVLPSLGETGVLAVTPGELFPGVTATATDTPEAAEVKGRERMAEVLARYVTDRQRLPDDVLVVDHDDGELLLDRRIAERARSRAREAGLPHNLARPHFAFEVIDQLTAQLVERIGADPYGGPNLLSADDAAQLGKEVAVSPAVHAAIEELWPVLTPRRLVADFLADPVYLDEADTGALRRQDGAWTQADVALLDEAAELLGEDDSAARAARETAHQERIAYAEGVLELSYGSRTQEFEDRDDEESEVLAAHDLVDAERLAERYEEADHRTAAERAAADRTWTFGHVIVDEAQELSPMMWRVLMRRCPTRSMTLVGDPAQTAEPGGTGDWDTMLRPYVGDRRRFTRLGVNYRTPAEIMDVAAAVLRSVDPSFEAPRSIRSTGVRPWARRAGDAGTLPGAVAGTVATTRAEVGAAGRCAVIAPADRHAALVDGLPDASAGDSPDLTRPVVVLRPRQAKGLEFDTVVVVEPERFEPSDLYVALTRATQRLAVVHTGELPEALRTLEQGA